MRSLTRRSILAGSAVIPTLPFSATAHSEDATLVSLGREFMHTVETLEAKNWEDDELFEKLETVEKGMLGIEAKTTEGLFAKAQAACWALLGDLDAEGGKTTDERMAISIVRDLVRLYAPTLERPGALKKVIERP